MKQAKRTNRAACALLVLAGCVFKSGGSSHGGEPTHDMDMNDVDMQRGEDASVSDGEAVPELDAGARQEDAGPVDAGDEEPAVIMGAWPGGAPGTADHDMTFGGNLSGLTFRAATASEPELLW